MPIYRPIPVKYVGDPRDFIYQRPLGDLPASIDYRPLSPAIEDQSQWGTCTANSTAAACELILAANNKFVHLSRMFNYYESRKHIGIVGDNGSFTREAVAAAYKVGYPEEALWPYNAADLEATPPQSVYDNAATRKIDRYERIWNGYTYTYDSQGYPIAAIGSTRTTGDANWIRDVKSSLNEGYPVVIALAVTRIFEEITGNFDYQYAHPYHGETADDPSVGGHAVFIIGYDDAYSAFIIQNSWGYGWGYGGCGLLPYSTCPKIYDAFVIKGFMGMKIPKEALLPPVIAEPTVFPKYDIPPSLVPSDPTYYLGDFAMAVLSSDLKWRKSAVVSAIASTNGGVMNFTAAGAITSNVKNNLFPDVSQVERTAGSVVFRKVFLHVDKVSQDELLNARISLAGVTAAGDFVAFYAGTKNDTEATMDATRPYGVGLLSVAATAGATAITITPENEQWYKTHTPFRVGDLICVSDATNADYVTINTVTYTDNNTVEITCTALTHAFATSAVVATVFSAASTKAVVSTPAVTSTAGVFSDVGNLIVNDRGTVDDVWTITFTNATTFTITGVASGTVGTGTVGSGASPTYNGGANTYFQINSTGFSGTFAAGNTIVFNTYSASIPLWMQRVVPAGTSDISNNSTSLTVQAESY